MEQLLIFHHSVVYNLEVIASCTLKWAMNEHGHYLFPCFASQLLDSANTEQTSCWRAMAAENSSGGPPGAGRRPPFLLAERAEGWRPLPPRLPSQAQALI